MVRAAVRSRRQAFKRRLNKLTGDMHVATDGPLTFATRGANPSSASDYIERVSSPAIDVTLRRHDIIARLLETGEWNPETTECIQTFSKLVRSLDEGITFIRQLCDIIPPLELRAVHRELVRGISQFVRGEIFLTETIIAVDADEAATMEAKASNAIADGAKRFQQVSALVELVRRKPDADLFRIDGSVDVAAFVWSSVNLSTTSLTDVATLVRQSFADITGVAELADEQAILLLPILAVGAGVVDPETLSRRVRQLRTIIDFEQPSSWVNDPSFFVSRVQRGIERVLAQMERLGREARYGLPRDHVMNSETEVYRNLIEGAFRDLGTIVLVAARARRGDENGEYEIAVVDGVKAGDVVAELERMGQPCGGAINMLYRNASAHADVEVTDTGVVLIERRIANGREVSRDQEALSDAEFSEEMVALQEILVALQLAILPWLWSTSDQALAAAMAGAAITKRQRDQIIAIIAGTAGLRDVGVVVNGSTAIISATSYEDTTDRRESKIVSLVPALLGVSPDAQQVSLKISGLHPVTFERVEFFQGVPDEPPHKLPMLGLVTARWLLESGFHWDERDEATYVTFPMTMLHLSCCRLAGSAPPQTENLDRAVASLRVVLTQLDRVFPQDRWSQLTRQAVDLCATLATDLNGLAEIQRGRRNKADGAQLGLEAAATIESIYQVQEMAKSLRDGL